uniref:Uncharacterized protein n=1 Tax=Timema poppense TaxID=170557 RepID=A0A7R9DPU5_TIMPO|nr:unnamed protein product [Timema poppensis]
MSINFTFPLLRASQAQLLQDRVTQGKEQLKRSHASYCQGMESDQSEIKLLIKEVRKTSANVRRRIRDNIRTEFSRYILASEQPVQPPQPEYHNLSENI